MMTSPSGIRMLQYIAPIYGESTIMQALFEVSGKEIDDLRGWCAEIAAQSFPQTATWGLKYWEQLLGITVDETKDITARREYIIARLRSAGTPTKKLIVDAAKAFTNGDIDVYPGTEPYHLTIEFTNTQGVPPNFDDFVDMVSRVAPAHLVVDYLITYNTYFYLTQFTYSHLAGYTYQQVRELGTM